MDQQVGLWGQRHGVRGLRTYPLGALHGTHCRSGRGTGGTGRDWLGLGFTGIGLAEVCFQRIMCAVQIRNCVLYVLLGIRLMLVMHCMGAILMVLDMRVGKRVCFFHMSPKEKRMAAAIPCEIFSLLLFQLELLQVGFVQRVAGAELHAEAEGDAVEQEVLRREGDAARLHGEGHCHSIEKQIGAAKLNQTGVRITLTFDAEGERITGCSCQRGSSTSRNQGVAGAGKGATLVQPKQYGGGGTMHIQIACGKDRELLTFGRGACIHNRSVGNSSWRGKSGSTGPSACIRENLDPYACTADYEGIVTACAASANYIAHFAFPLLAWFNFCRQ